MSKKGRGADICSRQCRRVLPGHQVLSGRSWPGTFRAATMDVGDWLRSLGFGQIRSRFSGERDRRQSPIATPPPITHDAQGTVRRAFSRRRTNQAGPRQSQHAYAGLALRDLPRPRSAPSLRHTALACFAKLAAAGRSPRASLTQKRVVRGTGKKTFALIYITVTESFRNWGAEKKSGRPCNRNAVGRR
jgi:hypothetical protein